MAKTKEISFSLERRISDKNFGSLGYAVFESVTLEPGDKSSEEYVKLKSKVSKRASLLDKELSDLVERMNRTQTRKRNDDD